MKKRVKILLASLAIVASMIMPAKATYYTYGNRGDYMGKLNLYMSGETRYGLAGTYVQDNKYIVNTITAELIDNGRSKAYKSNSMSSGATTKTVVCNYSGVVGKHTIISPSNGNWNGTT
ncbi:hypothetical protein SAMN04487886_111011 [Clostridium sp. DSM 8431]|uniref:hypothetical protein n=1 Tax=Clostridium sp. DSM 8431 TaxID=1761781 RepID=UPI0008F0D85B|nr:hypothetical protein [Clostridium sp. DSM 8431]SFU70652.1 hypothetical protein SAMN04487886_111011 [Clostridium sp. DSM 8431]